MLETLARGALGAVLLVAATLCAYAPALHGEFVWDDDVIVLLNRTLRSADGLRRIWLEPGAVLQYYPLVHTSYWLEYHAWGREPFGYHLVNVLLHAVNAVLVWRLLRRLAVPGAFAAAAIFALHPVHVESVAWISERKNVLSGAFYLAAILAYLRFRPLDASPPSRPVAWYACATALFVCSLLSKTVTLTLPVAILILVWWKRGRVERRDVGALIPLVLVAIPLGLVTVWAEKRFVGATGQDWSLSLVDRLLIAGRAPWFYAGKLAWPRTLAFMYPRWDLDASVWWQSLLPFTVLAVLCAAWLLRRRLGRSPLAALLFFVGTLVPALGFFDVYPMRYSFVADHFQYLASLGLIALAIGAMTHALMRRGPAALAIGRAAAVVLVLVLGVLTWRQSHIYHDAETLWRNTVTSSPTSWMAHNNLGLLLAAKGRPADAVPEYTEALRIRPGMPEVLDNLGNALAAVGRRDEAIRQYEESLRVRPGSPLVHSNLAVVLAGAGRLADAEAHYREALRQKSDYVVAMVNLGVLLQGQGRLDEAISLFGEALRLQPDSADAHHNLAVVLAATGHQAEARAQMAEAQRLRASPESAYRPR